MRLMVVVHFVQLKDKGKIRRGTSDPFPSAQRAETRADHL